MKISHLAYHIIEEYTSVDGGITPLKLQKLLYYTKVWGLVSGQLLVNGQFKAWKNGPVNGYIYGKYKSMAIHPFRWKTKRALSQLPKKS